jgi:hypothetical protein
VNYLVPDHNPPTRAEYDELYAQFIGLILSTGKVEARVPHSIKHPLTGHAGNLVVAKEVDEVRHQTVYTVVPMPPAQ